MAENFYTILTATGKAKLANSAVLGSKVNFKTLKVGDGKGAYYEPSENQTSLVNQVWSGNISSISVDESNPSWIVIETIIPAAIGGFFIREAGIFDEAGDLIAISKLSETYKPVVAEGSIKDLCIKIILEVSNVESVTLKIDPTIILAKKSDVEELRSEINTQLSDLTNVVKTTATVSYGMNNVIKRTSKVSSSPKFTIQGKTIINLLGKDGNCEDISKWAFAGAGSTYSLDSNNKVFGSNGFKINIGNDTAGAIGKDILSILNTSKYYCLSMYLKNGNGSGMRIRLSDGTNNSYSSTISDTTKFNRTSIKIQPSDFTGKSNFYIYARVDGTSGQYGYVDGIMLEEITQAQFNDSGFQPSPYVDSYTCLQNPYVEIRHNNLVINGNTENDVSYWKANNVNLSLSVVNNKFRFNVTVAGGAYYQLIPVKSNTIYNLSANITAGIFIGVNTKDNGFRIHEGTGTFNSGNNDCVNIVIYGLTIGTYDFDSIMLVEGSVAPLAYKSCKIQRMVIEGKFSDGDNVVYKDGKVTGQRNTKHATLYGKDYDWQFEGDLLAGSKGIKVPLLKDSSASNGAVGNVLIKYDGKVCVEKWTNTVVDAFYNEAGYLHFVLADSDTGWTETINPNNNEVKAFLNGWRAVFNTSAGGGRYIAWTHFTGSSSFLSADTSASTTNSNVVNFSSHQFAAGDLVVCPYASGSIFTVTAVTSTTITLNSTITVSANQTFFKSDDGTSTKVLNYCVNNVAQGYDGYQLHYKLQNPEQLTDINCHREGNILTLEEGENYLYLDSGMVLGEVANPIIQSDGIAYQINNFTVGGSKAFLKNKTENFNGVYKNNIIDNKWTEQANNASYGKVCVWEYVADFDSTATYTVDYKILATIAPQIGAIDCEYVEDIISSINSLQEAVDSRQIGNSALDDIIDMSLYERIVTGDGGIADWGAWLYDNTNIYVALMWPFSVVKSTVPKFTVNSYAIYLGNGVNITSKFKIGTVKATKTNFIVSYYSTDATTISNIKNYGYWITADVTADCRERV